MQTSSSVFDAFGGFGLNKFVDLYFIIIQVVRGITDRELVCALKVPMFGTGSSHILSRISTMG